jgi:hypothetical protein
MNSYRSIFSAATSRERRDNFEAYWLYSQDHAGAILEGEKDLTLKREALVRFQAQLVRVRKPLENPESFYRNYVRMVDDPRSLDRRTLFLTFLYKFARHEWAGICAVWDGIPSMARSRSTTEKISRYHLCEEFCHIRLFHEMFRVFHLDHVEWVPLGKWMGRVYRCLPRLPEPIMSPPAFVSELMGLTLYRHLARLLDDILADDPQARAHLEAMLREITIDELAHTGQRRNFMGPIGVAASKRIIAPMFRAFYRGLPESEYLLDVDCMIEEAGAFDYSAMTRDVIAASWMPSYCRNGPRPALAGT